MDVDPRIRHPEHTEGAIPSNIYLREDQLLAGDQLNLYIKAQVAIMKRTFFDPMIAGPAPIEFPGADEAALMMVKHRPMHQVSVFQVQHYVRKGKWIGIATLSTLESELLKIRPDFDQFMKLVAIEPDPA
jgi:hypothetical protein